MPKRGGRSPTPLDDQTLQAVVKQHISEATGSQIGSDGGGDLAHQRQKSMEYYFGEPLGNEVEGRSQVIDTVVQDTIEWMLPSILEIFTAGDEVVRFEPVGPEDEEHAKQATDYVNHVFQKDNDGFQILYDIFKDALLQKTGVAKVYWEEREEQKRHTYTGLTKDEMSLILSEKNVKALEHEEYVAQVTGPMGEVADVPLHDLTILRTEMEGRTRIDTVPPEELLISRRAIKLEDEKGRAVVPFVAHRVQKTVSELLEMGYSWDEVKDLPSYDEGEYNEERLARFGANDEWPIEGNDLDPAMRTIWIYECYLRVDYDGDGIAELRKVTVAGCGYKLLDNEPVDEQPFTACTPIPMPHKFFGQSVADLVMDLQEISSTLWRQTLDNVYHVNNARTAVSQKVELDDLLNQRVGGVIRVDTEMGDVDGHIRPQVTPSIVNHIIPAIEMVDQRKENRTGVSRYNQGLDPNSLNDTAAGINMLQSASMRRVQLIARIFANTGIKDMFKKILRIESKHRDAPRVIRLRNEYIPMDPREWNADMDVTVQVGLGYGSREQQLVAANMVLQMQEKMVAYQGGIHGPLVRADHVQHAAAKLIEAAGLGDSEPYIADIDPNQAMQPPSPLRTLRWRS